MEKINRYQYLKAREEYFRLGNSTNLTGDEKTILENYKEIYFNYETIHEFDVFESRIDRLLFFLPLTIIIPIWGIYDNWDLGLDNLLLESLFLFFSTLLFFIITTFFSPIAFIAAIAALPYIIFYYLSTEIIFELLKKILKENILNSVINFVSSIRLWFHKKLVKIYKY